MVLQADKGFDIQEAGNIQFKNITVLVKDNNPVIDVVQSNNLVFDKISYKDGADLLFRVSGDRVKNIDISRTDASKSKLRYSTDLGASEKVIKL